MNRPAQTAWIVTAALVMSVVVVSVATAQEKPAGTAAGISVNVAVVRTDAAKGLFVCTAEVSDLVSGEVFALPKVAFSSESGGKARMGRQPAPKKGPTEVVFDVQADKAGDSAAYTVSYKKEGVLVAVQKGSISLR